VPITESSILPDFPTLVCGAIQGFASDLGNALSHMHDTLARLQRELPDPFGLQMDIHTLFGPYLARSILEVTGTALIARSDPFRILTLRQVQSNANYAPGARNASSIQWLGDILAEGSAKAPLWATDRRADQMTRSLLGDYQAAVLWNPAFTRFLDAVGNRDNSGTWTRELQRLSPETFAPWARHQASDTYSSASKGVHHEFVVTMASYYDSATLMDLIESAVKVSSVLAVVFNFAEQAFLPLAPDLALDIFERLQP
jgi:hypothetical protein